MDSSTDIAVAKREIENGESIPAVAGKLSTRNPDADLDELIATANKAQKLVENGDEASSDDEETGATDDETVANDANETENQEERFEESPDWFDVDESEPPDAEQIHEDSTAGETEWSK